MNDILGNRMKGYENVSRTYLTRRMPTIIRLDGCHFHTFTKGLNKPFDDILMECMWETAKYLCANIQGCKLAYTQSDEITLLLTDYETINTDPWFDKNIQKMVSVSASMATLAFNKAFSKQVNELQIASTISSLWLDSDEKYLQLLESKLNSAMFDSRAFNIPKEEVCNCFIWRQVDATRNAIQMVGRANFSHKELDKKSSNQIQEMLFSEKGINFNDLPAYKKRGACIKKKTYTLDNDLNTVRSHWVVDKDIPIFTQDRDYIERYL